MSDAYATLLTTLREISLLGSIGSVLNYDERTVLPDKATPFRAEQLGLIARLHHEQFTSPRIDDLLRDVESGPLAADRASDPAVVVREVRRDYDRARKMPTSLVEAITVTSSLGEAAWVEARKSNDFKTFEPWLTRMLDLKLQEAKCVGYKESPYDALLDTYEPGETATSVQKIFDTFRPPLVDLIARIKDSGRTAPLEILERKYPVAKQKEIALEAARAIGFDFTAGRLDIAVHPFASGIGPGDTRMTTRYDENAFGDAFFGTLHESGHALYEQGLPKAKFFGTGLAESISLGIHESQSRMWENLVGRSKAFWKFFFGRTKSAFAPLIDDVSETQWMFAINDIRPSYIRVEADEATYNLHVMLRFELEQALVKGDLKPTDLPGVWNEKMKSYLGIAPPTDALGCLQDVHWSAGLFGYFPTYSLGNIYSAQFFEQAKKDLGDMDAMFAKGEFAPLLEWLRKNIHSQGKRYGARDLVKRVTGKDLTPEPLLKYLGGKAKEYYGV